MNNINISFKNVYLFPQYINQENRYGEAIRNLNGQLLLMMITMKTHPVQFYKY